MGQGFAKVLASVQGFGYFESLCMRCISRAWASPCSPALLISAPIVTMALAKNCLCSFVSCFCSLSV